MKKFFGLFLVAFCLLISPTNAKEDTDLHLVREILNEALTKYANHFCGPLQEFQGPFKGLEIKIQAVPKTDANGTMDLNWYDGKCFFEKAASITSSSIE